MTAGSSNYLKLAEASILDKFKPFPPRICLPFQLRAKCGFVGAIVGCEAALFAIEWQSAGWSVGCCDKAMDEWQVFDVVMVEN